MQHVHKLEGVIHKAITLGEESWMQLSTVGRV